MLLLLLKALLQTGRFPSVILANCVGRLTIDRDGGRIKLVATVLYNKHKANLKKVVRAPQQSLVSIHGDASGFINLIQCRIYMEIRGVKTSTLRVPAMMIR